MARRGARARRGRTGCGRRRPAAATGSARARRRRAPARRARRDRRSPSRRRRSARGPLWPWPRRSATTQAMPRAASVRDEAAAARAVERAAVDHHGVADDGDGARRRRRRRPRRGGPSRRRRRRRTARVGRRKRSITHPLIHDASAALPLRALDIACGSVMKFQKFLKVRESETGHASTGRAGSNHRATGRGGAPRTRSRRRRTRGWARSSCSSATSSPTSRTALPALADGGPGLAGRAARHLVGAGGKRVRPLLVILSARAAGVAGRRRWQTRAVADASWRRRPSWCTRPRCCTTTCSTTGARGAACRRRASCGATRRRCSAATSCSIRALELTAATGVAGALGDLLGAIGRMIDGEALQLQHRGRSDLDAAGYLDGRRRQDRVAVRLVRPRRRAAGRQRRPRRRRARRLRPAPRARLPDRRRRARRRGRSARARQVGAVRSARGQADAAGAVRARARAGAARACWTPASPPMPTRPATSPPPWRAPAPPRPRASGAARRRRAARRRARRPAADALVRGAPPHRARAVRAGGVMYPSLRAFVETLDGAGELVRIRRECDPNLEIAEIAARTMKLPGGGPALLFENPRGSRFPLAINVFGSQAAHGDGARRRARSRSTRTRWPSCSAAPRAARLAVGQAEDAAQAGARRRRAAQVDRAGRRRARRWSSERRRSDASCRS